MRKLFSPAVLKYVFFMTLIATLYVFFLVISYRIIVLQTNHMTSATESVNYIPKCFDSVQRLANNTSATRWRLEINCDQTTVTVNKQRVDQHQEPCRLNSTHDLKCLNTFIEKNCYSSKGQIVPNIVHYVWFGHNNFQHFVHFVSVLSAVRFQKTCAILFHCNEPPFGPYWTVLLSIVPNIILVQRDAPKTIYGKKPGFIEHKADVARLEVLNVSGGIYLDTDQMVVRGLDELLKEQFVMSHEVDKNLANSMILAKPRAPFIELWLAAYQSYNPSIWAYHSTIVPWDLAKKHPAMIKVVGNKFINPAYPRIMEAVKGHYNISDNYGLHIYPRLLPNIQLNLPDVATWNSSLGTLWRTILFNSSEIFSCNSTIK